MQAHPTLRLWCHCFGVHSKCWLKSLQVILMWNRGEISCLAGDCLGGSDPGFCTLSCEAAISKSLGKRGTEFSDLVQTFPSLSTDCFFLEECRVFFVKHDHSYPVKAVKGEHHAISQINKRAALGWRSSSRCDDKMGTPGGVRGA